jgi:hypothetical protein
MIVDAGRVRRIGTEGWAGLGGRRDLVAAVLGGAVVVGVYLDGRAHLLNLPDSFFTPWHGLLYGAVVALFAWLLLIGMAHGAAEGRWLRMPTGYGLALAGAVLFLVGGGLDMGWHAVFGIESGVDALLSPSHLWLFTAGALMLSGPVRAASARRATGAPATRLGLTAAVVAVWSLAGLAAFVTSFLSAYFTDAPARPLPHFPEGTPEHAAVEIPASWGLASYLVSSLMLTAPMAYLLLRWRLPFGTFTGYTSGLALLAVVLMDFQRSYMLASTALAGLVVDAFVYIARRRGLAVRAQAIASAGLLPAAAWSTQLAGMALVERVRWSPELIAGVVLLSALVSALAAGFLAAPSDDAARTDDEVVPGARRR